MKEVYKIILLLLFLSGIRCSTESDSYEELQKKKSLSDSDIRAVIARQYKAAIYGLNEMRKDPIKEYLVDSLFSEIVKWQTLLDNKGFEVDRLSKKQVSELDSIIYFRTLFKDNLQKIMFAE